jgi:hypothetical protein
MKKFFLSSQKNCALHLNAFSVFPDPRARFESRIMINLGVLMCVEYHR